MTKHREEGYSGRRSSIIELQRGGPKPPLFVVYPDIFSDFIRHLDSDLPVYGLMGLELVGRQRRQPRTSFPLTLRLHTPMITSCAAGFCLCAKTVVGGDNGILSIFVA